RCRAHLQEPDVRPMSPPPRRSSAFITRPPIRVLFLCVHNSARSQMAEGFARLVAPNGVQVGSAGSEPRGVHARTVEVMHEAGVDLGGHISKALDQVPWRECDTVVTLCDEAAAACPQLGGEVRRVHWPIPDPAEAPEKEQLAAFREARDEI